MIFALVPWFLAASATRQVVNLDAGWQYVRLVNPVHGTSSQELASVSSTDWKPATLPHAAWIRPMGSAQVWQGVCYYRRRIDMPEADLEKHVEITIEGAMQSSDLWLNGLHVASRQGGYLPLVADLSNRIKKENEILVRVDNSDNPLIPPGKPQQQLDFMYGNGLYRNAYLTVTDPLHITDPMIEDAPRSGGIYVTYPTVGSARAVVRVRTHIRNGSADVREFVVKQTLTETDNREVVESEVKSSLMPAAARQYEQDLNVVLPHLWSPDEPNRYRLHTSILVGGKPVDEVDTLIGIRKVDVSRATGFVLNGKPIRLVGTNRHQDYPWVGPALSDAANRRDAMMIRLAGHNIVRLSHYPQSPAFLDECDRIGLMTIPCIPGWQFMNKDPVFVERVRQDIRELIRRDRNHPSAVFWEASLNETYPPPGIAKDWDAVAKSESFDGRVLTAGDGTTGVPWDIVYNQWHEDLSRPQDAVSTRPGYIREYGDYEFGGAESTTRVRMGDGMDKLLQAAWNQIWSYNKFRPQYPWTMGAGTWEMFDHNVPWPFRISASGLADIFRRDKPGYWFYQSQEAKKPIVKVAASWEPGPPLRTVVVFTNCEEAELSVNGATIAREKPVRGRETLYDKAKPFDGSNSANLLHPPIVFRNVKYVRGVLKVLGLDGGKVVASEELRTPGAAVKLKVWVDDLGVAVTKNDLIFVRAAYVDANDTICTGEAGRIRFQVSGAGHLAGEADVLPELGVASALVRTGMDAGLVSISSSAGQLKPAEITLTY